EAIEAQEAIGLDALDDEADLVEVGTQHQAGAVMAAALDRGDVAVAVDAHRVGERGDALFEIRDHRLLESGHALQIEQLAQGLAQAILDVRRWAVHVVSPRSRSPFSSRRAHGGRASPAARRAP